MENSELKNTKNGWFRNFLFGKKKKDTSEKRVPCDCNVDIQGTKKDKTVQTTYNKEEEKPILNVNTYSDPKKIQKTGEFPGKMFPSERRGCGFHLYFSVDSGVKPNLVRNNKIKIVKNDKNKVGNNYLEVEKETISSVRDSESLSEMVKSHQSHSPFRNQRNINSGGREKSPSETHIVVPEITVKQYRESEVGNHINGSPKNQEEFKTRKGNSILRTKVPLSSSHNISTPGEATTTNYSPPHSSPERHINHEETELKNIIKQKSDTDFPKRLSDVDEEAMFKEYQALHKPKRRSSLKSRGTFTVNSLISLRKKRESFNDAMFPKILSKLDLIEEKLAELEVKIDEYREKNIENIVGISCSSANGIFPIDTKNQDNGSESNKNISTNTSASKPTSFKVQPVVIKSCGEDVFVNEPERISVVKKMRSKKGSGQLVYHNTQELDAHNITSKSFSKEKEMKSQITKTPIVVNSKDPHMWRRISEELKV